MMPPRGLDEEGDGEQKRPIFNPEEENFPF